MLNQQHLAHLLAQLASCSPTVSSAHLALQLLDLTRLKTIDDTAAIRQLCQQAIQMPVAIAAICVYPQFLPVAFQQLQQQESCIKLATVVNFPHGTQLSEVTILQIEQAVIAGATEIDMVLPYSDYFAGKTSEVLAYVSCCKVACGTEVLLKVILESGAFSSLDQLYQASCEVIAAGADFIKTSTGNLEPGVTFDAAYTMLNAIKTMQIQGYPVGLKISGGIKTLKQTAQYLMLAETLMGSAWLTPQHLRIGSSTLAPTLVDIINDNKIA